MLTRLQSGSLHQTSNNSAGGTAVATVGEGAGATLTRANAAVGGTSTAGGTAVAAVGEGAGATLTRANAAVGGTSTVGGTAVAAVGEGAGATLTRANVAVGGTSTAGGHDPIREIDHWFQGIRSFFLDFQIPIIGFFLDFQTPIIGFIASRFLGQLSGFPSYASPNPASNCSPGSIHGV
jgi:hypothetical protein